MPKLKLLLTSLTMLFVLCAPALAQSASPAADQYGNGVAAVRCPNGDLAQTQADVGDGACATAENAGQGSDAVNDALTGTASSASPSAAEALAPDETASSASAPAGSAGGENAFTNGEAEGDGVPASVTELPETGGVPLAALGVGVALIASGLAARRAAGR